ncbi:hypothetical protein PF010_g28091 [Phytophthora fragariae]|uniref:Uncharacterized protein n=1 Tax=Phytophthora fragariae TaxID=53985 RepID=A0A6G0JSL0_9STRA|nr:hypothetical protein PF010_g28091 [Phytophthora fragariae]
MAAPITQPQALQRCVYRILATKGMTSALIKSWKTSVQGRRTLTTERSSPGLLCTYVVHVVGGEGAADVEGVRFVGRQALRAQQEVTSALLSWQTTSWLTLKEKQTRQVWLCLVVDEVHVGFAEVGLLDAWLEQQELVHVVVMTVTRLAQLLSGLLLVAAVEHQLVESPSPNL